MTCLSSLLVLALAGCSCAGRSSEVRWPASGGGSLASELMITARAEHSGVPIAHDGTPIVEPDEALPDDAPGIRARSFVFQGIWYAEVELGEAAEGVELPLVFIFHGRGDHPRIPGGPFGRAPTPMRVIVPRGPLSLGSGFAWARSSVTQDHHDELAADIMAITDRLIRLIEHVQETRPTAGTPVVTGFSQGAIVSWTLALRFPDRIGLAIPIAGWVLPGNRPNALRAAPTRAMHGTADPIVRIEPTRAWVQALLASGNEVDFLEFDGVAHTVTPEMNLQFEEWLEEALLERAPSLGGGLGEAGAEEAPIAPYDEPVDVDPEAEAVPAPLAGEPDPLAVDEAVEPTEDEVPEEVPAEDETTELGPGAPAPEAEAPAP
jgi:phospholipase/carboxylesterase